MSAPQSTVDQPQRSTTNTSHNVTDSYEPERDTSFVFHTSRVAQQGEQISARAVGVVATYEIGEVYDEDEYDDEDVADLVTVDRPEKIPYVNKAVNLQLDGNDCVCEILPQYYIRFESDDLLTDVFLPIETYLKDGKRKLNVGAKLRKFKKFIGDQSKTDVSYLVPNPDVMGDSLYNINISTDEITFDMKNLYEPTVEPKNTTETVANRIGDVKNGNIGLFGRVMVLALLGLGIPILTLMLTGSLFVEMSPQYPLAMACGYYGGIYLLIENSNEWFGINMSDSVSSPNTPSHHMLEFEYQFDHPSDAHTVYQFGDDVSSGELVDVTTEIDDENGYCHIITVGSDESWSIELENGMMDESVVKWFEQVGSEKIDDVFTVRKTMYPDEDALRVKDDVFLVPQRG